MYPNQGRTFVLIQLIILTYAAGWLDGIYMGDVFYATYTQIFQPKNTSAWGVFVIAHFASAH